MYGIKWKKDLPLTASVVNISDLLHGIVSGHAGCKSREKEGIG